MKIITEPLSLNRRFVHQITKKRKTETKEEVSNISEQLRCVLDAHSSFLSCLLIARFCNLRFVSLLFSCVFKRMHLSFLS